MSLAELRLEDLRCLPRALLTLHPRLNLITGNNGTGKTSVLEAIYLLGRGRSFRTRHTEQLIRHGASRLLIFGRVTSTSGQSEAGFLRTVGLAYDRDKGVDARVDG